MPAISIENDHDYALIKELAELEGASMGTVVIEAVREMLERRRPATKPDNLAERLIEIGKRTAPLWNANSSHGELLYDENGLPK